MQGQSDPPLGENAQKAYERWRQLRLLRAVRIACLLSTLALAAFSVFDSLWRVSDLHSLLYARTLTLTGLLLVLVVTFTPRGVRHIDALAVLACLLLSGGAVLVCELAGSGLSIYRDPIYILFMGATLLVPWKPASAALCFASSIFFYDVLYFFSGGMGYLGTWLMTNALLLVAAVMGIASVKTIDRLRRIAFVYHRSLHRQSAAVEEQPQR